MADTKITALTALTAADPINDVIPIVDVSDTSMAASGTTKKISVNNILSSSPTASGALTVTGLVTAGSATITGDLTVRTNRLVATTTGVGIGTTTLFGDLNIQNGSNCRLEVTSQAGGTTIENLNNARNAYLNMTMFADAYIWNRLGSEAMRLNSTGLGVGGSPTAKISCAGFSSANVAPDFQINRSSSGTAIQTGPNIVFTDGTSNNTVTIQNSQGRFGIWNYGAGAWNERLSVDSSGNVGIGVTPSAWNSSYKAIQTQGGAVVSGTTGHLRLYQNGFQNASNQQIYINSLAASLYSQDAGSHIWFNAPSGTAGNAITFTQAMTLDASGNLLVGTTDTSSTSGAGFKIIGSGLGPYVVNAASTNAALAYTMYSTGAAAYRFYVGWGGTVFATNTTISAISDARLKENVQDIDVGLGAILALKPRKFDWKEGKGKNIKGDRGFIAQEFEQVFPQLVDEWKDAAPEGETPYKSVRQDLIPVLVKAIQELTARVQTLETR